MPYRCPQCGAFFVDGETCQDYFDTCQLKEIEQPAYYAVHHLSVPCYMLQHNAYAREGWLEVRKLLGKFVYDGWTRAMARRHYRVAADSGHRTWSFTRGARLQGGEAIVWRFTVADVKLVTAELYCTDVRHWAESILADTEALVRSVDPAALR